MVDGRNTALKSSGPRAVALAAAIAAAMLAPGTSRLHAQEGTCGAVGPTANVVCSDPALSDLAEQLTGAVRELLSATAQPERRGLIREQRDWSLGLRDCLAGDAAKECLGDAYELRISDLASRLDTAAGPVEAGAEAGGAGEIPVGQAELPPLAGAAQSTPGVSSEADGIAAAASGEPADADAGEAGNELGALRGEPAAESAPGSAPESATAGTGGSQVDAILTDTVWKADIATGVRPGTIFVFQKNGALVTADCVESYRLGSWKIGEDGKLSLDEGRGAKRSAEIVSARDGFVRLQIEDSDDLRGTVVLRPALAPFSCKSG